MDPTTSFARDIHDRGWVMIRVSRRDQRRLSDWADGRAISARRQLLTQVGTLPLT